MVNVTSHLPFNLHNRALPDDSLANSRSGSRSVDLHHAQGYEDGRLRPRRLSSQERSRPPSVYDRQRPYSRPPSPESVCRDTIRREPILNLKLVGYVPPSRGRRMSKNSDTAKKESPGPDISRSINSSAGVVTPPVSLACDLYRLRADFKQISAGTPSVTAPRCRSNMYKLGRLMIRISALPSRFQKSVLSIFSSLIKT